MYRIVTMFGDNGPQWLFEDQEEGVEAEKTFESFEEARRAHEKQWITIHQNYEYISMKRSSLSAFQSDGSKRWCEEYDDGLQQYKGLALLKDHQPTTVESKKEFYETANSSGKTKRRERSKQGVWC